MIGCVLVLLFLAAAPPGESPTVDLSGRWIPDPAAYESRKELKNPDPAAPPPAVTPEPGRLIISGKGEFLVFELLDKEGTPISTTKVSTGGETTMNPRAGGDLAHASKSRWEGRALITQWRLTRGDAEVMRGTDRWELSQDRSTLTLIGTTEDTKSRSRSKTVYRRER
ncbi:MAG TPA: hypothetical protein VFW45_11430 [Candidatus Polarisedimenticolia bacterium]|nr:hypothetical protein [Candidatus Polarisedimenticolia bacterium]